MKIANPIYDAVFKYLLEDKRVAKLLLSTILDEEILDINIQPTEHSIELERPPVTVYRIDFSAKIRSGSGEQLVLIELQKAKFAQDLFRFRRHLGNHYANRENQTTDPKTGRTVPIPIITIYFLGEAISDLPAPVIKVNRECIDIATGERFTKKLQFIECLTHNSFIIQIPHLKEKRRTELEKLLLFFDQSNAIEDRHTLSIHEDQIPQQHQLLLDRLRRAIEDQNIRGAMDVEDDIVLELEDKDREIQKHRDRAEQEKQRAEEALQREEHERKNAEQEKQRAEEALRREEHERKNAEMEKQRAELAKVRAEEAEQREEQEKKRADENEQKLAEALKRLQELEQGSSDK
jgi:flagellar biosynthesis GTPase FlhF